jgi:hypothetical protein
VNVKLFKVSVTVEAYVISECAEAAAQYARDNQDLWETEEGTTEAVEVDSKDFPQDRRASQPWYADDLPLWLVKESAGKTYSQWLDQFEDEKAEAVRHAEFEKKQLKLFE